MNNLRDKIKKITSDEPSNWKEKAQLRKNTPWLREYSSKIARRILSAIEGNKDLNQVKLAESLNVTPQQISKIVKGQENMTLETIYKLSKALNFELISFPEYKYSYAYSQTINSNDFLNEITNDSKRIFGNTTGVILQSIKAIEIEKTDLSSKIFVQALYTHNTTNQQTEING